MLLKKIMPVLSLAFGLLIGIGIVGYKCVQDQENKPVSVVEAEEKIPIGCKVNANGQTYGSAKAKSMQALPDLIGVVGDNGVKGYLYREDFIGKMPSSPEEALRIQAEKDERLAKGEDVNTVYSVYAEDGVTVVDTFTTEYGHNAEYYGIK